MKRGALVAVLALVATACGAPSSFDGVTGGSKEDVSIEAPRPISPVSVSFIASARPRLKWALGPTATGAVVELSRTRDFATVAKTYQGAGSELAVPEDLDLGIWYWRLRGAIGSSLGSVTGPVWEMLVRGPAAHGANDPPTRALNDVNGDGVPDLFIGTNTYDDGGADGTATAPALGGVAVGTVPPPRATSPAVFLYDGHPDVGFTRMKIGLYGAPSTSYNGPMTIGAGTDFDGDGLPDMIEAGSFTFTTPDRSAPAASGKTVVLFQSSITFGAASADVPVDLGRGGQFYFGVDPTTLPQVHEGGDVDGDGYGDSIMGLDNVGFLVLGSVSKLTSTPATMVIGGVEGTSNFSRVALGAFDANGDGLSDVAFSFTSSYEPTARAFAAPGDRGQRVAGPTMLDAPDAQVATAFAAGDFNGDGLDDVAITTPVGTSARVCMWFGDRDRFLLKGPCTMAPAGDLEFGASLTAADLEGDGIDELLVTAKNGGVDGVRVVRIAPDGTTTAAPIGQPGLGVRLTTIWPGRPGKARWAAVAADGSRVGIYEGDALAQTLIPTNDVSDGFGRGIR